MKTLLHRSRKADHLRYSLELPDGPQQTGFSDIQLVHNCLSGLDFSAVDLSTAIAGIKLPHPLVINAMTGGDQSVMETNRRLAIAAKRTNAAMAVGSQNIALKDPSVINTFTVVREENPDGVIFANIGAYATARQAQSVVDMLGADALQIHLNIAQEMVMPEGDRDFRGYLDNIKKIIAVLDVPVIVKETGCGIAMEQAGELIAAGVSAIDISGCGGSNFLAIEAARGEAFAHPELLSWGITTAASTLEAATVAKGRADIVVSGGIRSALDLAKALACGGRAAGIAAMFLRTLAKSGNDEESVSQSITDLLDGLKKTMLLAGAANIDDLHKKPIVITGNTREWLTARGIAIENFGYARGEAHK